MKQRTRPAMDTILANSFIYDKQQKDFSFSDKLQIKVDDEND